MSRNDMLFITISRRIMMTVSDLKGNRVIVGIDYRIQKMMSMVMAMVSVMLQRVVAKIPKEVEMEMGMEMEMEMEMETGKEMEMGMVMEMGMGMGMGMVMEMGMGMVISLRHCFWCMIHFKKAVWKLFIDGKSLVMVFASALLIHRATPFLPQHFMPDKDGLTNTI